MEEESNIKPIEDESKDNIEEAKTLNDDDDKNEEDKPLEEAIQEEDKPLEEIKPKRKVGQPKKPISQRMLMKEKMECPDCHRTISKHCYQYKHKNCCIVKKVETIQAKKPKKIEEVKPLPAPVISEREIKNRVEQFNNNNNTEAKPLDENEVINKYLNKIKEEEKQKKQNQIKTF
jgi:hypothetical protein